MSGNADTVLTSKDNVGEGTDGGVGVGVGVDEP